MAKTNKLVSPFLKWVGGKRQIMSSIVSLLPENIRSFRYVEPFIGGGAVLFHLQPEKAIINDFNAELVNVYKIIKNRLEELITDLNKHKNDAAYFYELRALDRKPEFKKLSAVQRASRVIYLNKTCFNGLYRVNSSGEFNAPFGRYRNPNIVNEPTLKAVNKYLNANDIQIFNKDYQAILSTLDKRSFVYIDPPYHPISENPNFTGYIQGGWDSNDQLRLKQTCDELTKKGIKFLQSNSSSSLIKHLYGEYQIIAVKANRVVNADKSGRGEIEELLIKNYD
jgi:DNA adenine methylase